MDLKIKQFVIVMVYVHNTFMLLCPATNQNYLKII